MILIWGESITLHCCYQAYWHQRYWRVWESKLLLLDMKQQWKWTINCFFWYTVIKIIQGASFKEKKKVVTANGIFKFTIIPLVSSKDLKQTLHGSQQWFWSHFSVRLESFTGFKKGQKTRKDKSKSFSFASFTSLHFSVKKEMYSVLFCCCKSLSPGEMNQPLFVTIITPADTEGTTDEKTKSRLLLLDVSAVTAAL